MNEFKYNDRVRAFGLTGNVIQTTKTDVDYPVTVYFDNDFVQTFTRDGRADVRHVEPSLNLVQRKVKTVKKKLYLGIKTAPDYGSTRGAHETSYAYPKLEDVESMFLSHHEVVEVEIEIEIQE